MKRKLMLGSNKGYIKTGLIIDLDGYNAPVNNEWLSSVNGYKFDANTITYDRVGKKYIFNGNGSSYSKQVVNYNGSSVVTIQIVDDGSLYNNTSLSIPLESSPDFNKNPYCFLLTLSEVNSKELRLVSRNTVSNGYVLGYGGPIRSIKTLYTFVLGNGYYKLYINDELIGLKYLTYGNGGSSLTSYSPYVLYLGARNNSFYKTKMGLHSFRIYNRELSLSEIQANLSVDKQRFVF